MKEQDKKAEIVAGYGVPPDEWLENPSVYKIKRAHLELLNLIPPNDSLILDCGCGPGTYGVILAQEGGKVIGIDISAPAAGAHMMKKKERMNTWANVLVKNIFFLMESPHLNN